MCMSISNKDIQDVSVILNLNFRSINVNLKLIKWFLNYPEKRAEKVIIFH